MSTHPIQWQSPQPLWARFDASAAAGASAADQARPAILRFASDEFMDQMLGLLERDPSQLDRLLARPETWRKPMEDTAADSVERVPVPRSVLDRLRLGAAKKPKSRVAAVASQQALQEQAVSRSVPLKLYQPAHQRYYLAAASLVCGLPGYPERAVARGGSELVNFVVRRVLRQPAASEDPADEREFAYVKDASGARWQLAADGQAQLAPGEELLPVFPLAYRDDAQHPRSLWAGLIAAGRREEYLGADVIRSAAAGFAAGQRQSIEPATGQAPAQSKQARLAQFKLDVSEPWKNLVRSAYKTWQSVNASAPDGLSGGDTDQNKRARVFAFNLEQQLPAWLILLDFADYLAAYLPDLWQVIRNDGAGAASLPSVRRDLYTWLAAAGMSTGLATGLLPGVSGPALKPTASSLAAALKRIVAARAGLEGARRMYNADSHGDSDWPDFHYLLGGIERRETTGGPVFTPFDPFASASAADAPDPQDVESEQGPPSLSLALQQIEQAAAKVDVLTAKVVRALDPGAESDAPAPPFALQVARRLAKTAGDDGWFVIRFAYTRRDCGPLHPPALSAPTQKFQLASFFDPDAPARPIRISLPLDTSPAGLRKHKKNTAFVISDMLCGQIQRAKGLGLGDLVRSVLPWPLHKDLDVGAGGPCQSGGTSIGMICSLSIPIVTICALILLMIIVSLLDFIFRWLPWFVICFPVLGFKGKKG